MLMSYMPKANTDATSTTAAVTVHVGTPVELALLPFVGEEPVPDVPDEDPGTVSFVPEATVLVPLSINVSHVVGLTFSMSVGALGIQASTLRWALMGS